MTESTMTPATVIEGQPTVDLERMTVTLMAAGNNWAGESGLMARNAFAHLRILTNANAQLRTDAMTNRHAIGVLTDEARRFKDAVRDAAIGVQAGHYNHISKEALNGWLEELGLDPVVTEWDCEGTWRGIDLPGARVTADSEDEAESKYRDALSEASVSVLLQLSGDVSDTDDVIFGTNSLDDTVDWDDEVAFDIDDVEVSVSEA